MSSRDRLSVIEEQRGYPMARCGRGGYCELTREGETTEDLRPCWGSDEDGAGQPGWNGQCPYQI